MECCAQDRDSVLRRMSRRQGRPGNGYHFWFEYCEGPIKVPVKTGELPNEIERASNEPIQPAPPKPEDVGKFGLQVQELTKEVAERLHLAVQRGVIVTEVEDNSLAAQQDIQREDVITEVASKPFTNVQSFLEALTQDDPRRGVLLYLDRKGSKTFAVIKAENG